MNVVPVVETTISARRSVPPPPPPPQSYQQQPWGYNESYQQPQRQPANYEEAIMTKNKYKYDLDIVRVDTFKETIEYLKNN